MVDTQFLQWLSTLGVGGVLAGVIFFFYRKDAKVYADLWRGQSEMFRTVVTENTKAVTELTVLLETERGRNGR